MLPASASIDWSDAQERCYARIHTHRDDTCFPPLPAEHRELREDAAIRAAGWTDIELDPPRAIRSVRLNIACTGEAGVPKVRQICTWGVVDLFVAAAARAVVKSDVPVVARASFDDPGPLLALRPDSPVVRTLN